MQSDLLKYLLELDPKVDKDETEALNETPQKILDHFATGKTERLAEMKARFEEWRSYLNVPGNIYMKDAFELTDAQLDNYYAHGYQLFNAGDYRNAFNIFRFLVFCKISEGDYLYGLARTLDQLGFFNLAIYFYQITSAVQPKNPVPCYCASECCRKVGHYIFALEHLEYAFHVCAKQKKYEPLKARIFLNFDGYLGSCAESVSGKKTSRKGNKKKKSSPDKTKSKMKAKAKRAN